MNHTRARFETYGFRATALLAFIWLATPMSRLVGQDPAEKVEASSEYDVLFTKGRDIYASKCANCHGDKGEGVSGSYPNPLIGDATISELTKVIDETMPEGEPSECVGEDARAVAFYIHRDFYSEEAQRRLSAPRASLSRLTAQQLRQSLSDIYAKFSGIAERKTERGVRGNYFQGDRWKKENLKIERVDRTLDFDFGRESPGEGIDPTSFYIYWEGSIKVDHTGFYEIVIRSTCSFKMEFGKIGRLFIDNHVQSGDKTEFRERIHLVGGRIYPFKIDFIQRKRKTELPPAKFSLSWVRPGGVEEILPERNLIPQTSAGVFSLQATLPPDDRTYGYERGISISKQWDESVTAAAVEFAKVVTNELYPRFVKKKEDGSDGRQALKGFLREVLSVAFRMPLDDELADAYVTKQVDQTEDDADAIRRVLLLGLKSPRFLYPLLDSNKTPSQQAANRLALTLFDSLPSDEWLLKRMNNGELHSEPQIREAAKRMMTDYRVEAKTRDLIYEWLSLSQTKEVSKDSERFPGFDASLVQALRDSFDAFVDEIITSESSDFRQFFLADWAYTSKRIAEFYGDDWKPIDDTTRLQKTASTNPKWHGVLTHPYLMSRFAYHDATSPIHRGIFLIRFVLGRTLRPPMDAFAPLSPDLHPDLTTRERVNLQTSPQNCQVCHSKINGLGFVLENYDAVGRFRLVERDRPIDATGSYLSRSDEVIPFQNAADLASYLAKSPDVAQAFVNRAFQYFVKQPPSAFGSETLEKLTDRFVASGYNIRDLLIEIAVVSASPMPAPPSPNSPSPNP